MGNAECGLAAGWVERRGRMAPFESLLLLFEKVADLGEKFLLGGAFGRRGRLGHEAVHQLDHEEDGRGDDEEIKAVLDEGTITDGDGGGLGASGAQHKAEILEIDATGEYTEDGHDQVFNQGADDFTEGGADDDTDGEINDVAAEEKGFEFFGNGHLLTLSLG